ncbi:secretin N-terminal domain-containing protein [Pseudobacteriovorax antillogorgiicola]|uniref:Type IV pilus secretin (Or competence protein) PilQ n=1 Tax=Pseudobacteriovorax antillogorgiicola TaxID=1513793 RepID=A0A1Y6B5G5_9BACT|nr:secretin N-terminal domain-containing protein [Pseudobacteriovorax antillogorgiicola]TCS58913.1 type IV pilus secretin PilQ/predicted competence protein [Pseudobacteriovorax antillogorgiicola]SME93275.1 type IV pilus secretin (or competence protein) PilQ [Pseudobacteriovorax antillogorgiicola]
MVRCSNGWGLIFGLPLILFLSLMGSCSTSPDDAINPEEALEEEDNNFSDQEEFEANEDDSDVEQNNNSEENDNFNNQEGDEQADGFGNDEFEDFADTETGSEEDVGFGENDDLLFDDSGENINFQPLADEGDFEGQDDNIFAENQSNSIGIEGQQEFASNNGNMFADENTQIPLEQNTPVENSFSNVGNAPSVIGGDDFGSAAPIESTAVDSQSVVPANGVETRAAEIAPVYHKLNWVGYEIDDESKRLMISIITRGTPEFEIFQEQNQSVQPELVIRFFQTELRKKIKWDIDASEFRSPVAYIRMRDDKVRGLVDVILTFRDPVEGRFLAKDSNITLNFPIPEYYYGNLRVVQDRLRDKAEKLGSAEISLLLEQDSQQPRNLGNQRDQDLEPEQGEMIDRVISPEQGIDGSGLPDNFSWQDAPVFERTLFAVTSFSVLSVGQDNGELLEENNFPQEALESQQQEEQDLGQQQEEQEFQQGNQQQNQFLNQQEEIGQFQQEQAQQENSLNNENLQGLNGNFNQEAANNAGLGPMNQGNNGDFFGNSGDNAAIQAFNQENLGNFGNEALNEDLNFENDAPMGNNSGMVDNVMVNELEAMDENGNVIAEPSPVNSTRSPRRSDQEKLVYMEFTDAPLSLVFKSFSEETGNNFIFPNSVGDLTVSIHFRGVPWDEALKAILETHSLGMVRVGESIVRVDAVDRLTTYLQTLERAQQFEARRTPTKILVFRLNNAVAADIVNRINELIARDKQIDPRIQVSADPRTNSVVMEAPDYVLAKSKSIIERLDLKTPQVEIASRIVEVQKTNSDLFGVSWLNQALLNFDPGRGLGFGSLNFPNSLTSSFAVDPGIRAAPAVGNAQFKFGSINKFIDLDLLLRMEERRGTTNVLQSNRVLVLDGQDALILAGNSKFFRPAAGAVVGGGAGDAGGAGAEGLSEVKFNLSLQVKPQVTADGSVIMDLEIKSDTPGAPTGEVLADKNTRELNTQMVRESGDTGVIGGIYDTSKTETVVGIPFFSNLPIIGTLFRSTITEESQTELLIMVTPTIVTTDGSEDRGNTAGAPRSEGNNFDNINF